MEMIKILQFITLAVVLYVYNKSIAKEIARLSMYFPKKLIKQHSHLAMPERFIEVSSRFALYIGVAVALGFALRPVLGL